MDAALADYTTGTAARVMPSGPSPQSHPQPLARQVLGQPRKRSRSPASPPVSEGRSINVLGSACRQGNPTEDHMATVMDHKNCKQCGFEFGHEEFNCRTDEWNFDCRRCGYGESLKWIAAQDGSRVG